MHQSRREFIVKSAGVSAALMAGPAFGALSGEQKKLKILFLGGTGFLGPHTIEILRARGHEVTLFNRGNRPELFEDLEQIVGNRIASEAPGLEPLRAEIEKGLEDLRRTGQKRVGRGREATEEVAGLRTSLAAEVASTQVAHLPSLNRAMDGEDGGKGAM